MEKKIAVITGGASGIGRACAELLSREYRVIVADIKDAESTASTLEGARGIWVDVSDLASCEALAAEVGAMGGAEVLVHCAGIMNGRGMALDELPVDMWSQLMQVNFNGTFFMMRAFSPVLHDGGRVVFISSRVGRTGSNRMDIRMVTGGHYCAAKAGVNSLTKSFALELAPRGIRVNAVAPGPILTPIAQPGSDSVILPYIPLGRRGTPLEVAQGVRFLCSEESSYITGHVLDINGGMNMV